MSVEEILEAVRVLSPEERAQAGLRAAGAPGETVRRPATGRTHHTPVEIKGRPLSWTIVDERR